MNNLAGMLSDQGKYEEAEAIHRQKPEPSSRGKYEEAEKIHRQTLELRKKVLGKKHPDTDASQLVEEAAIPIEANPSYRRTRFSLRSFVRSLLQTELVSNKL